MSHVRLLRGTAENSVRCSVLPKRSHSVHTLDSRIFLTNTHLNDKLTVLTNEIVHRFVARIYIVYVAYQRQAQQPWNFAQSVVVISKSMKYCGICRGMPLD
jgi:hypothetical protein